MGLTKELGPGPVALDTAIFIYFIEEHPTFLPLVEPVFSAIDRGKPEVVTSGLTLLETLVAPYRAGNSRLAERYEALLTRSRGVRLVDLDRSLLRAAAQLRAASNVKTPDALQLAAAVTTGCTAYLTNDRALPPLPGLRILQLKNFVSQT